MRVLNTTLTFVFLASILLTGCNKFKQDLNDNTPPFVEIGIPIDQKTIRTSRKEWGLTERYVQLKPVKRQYEFFISAQDKGGLESIVIEVCPDSILVQGSLTELSKTFDPKKTGSYLVSGKLKPLKQNQKISIKATVKGKDRSGSKTHTTSIYGFANERQLFQSGGRPHKDYCKEGVPTTKHVTISIERPTDVTEGIAYCGCAYNDFQQKNIQCKNKNTVCKDNAPGVTTNTMAKSVENMHNTMTLEVTFPDQTVQTIPPRSIVPYTGKIIGTWTAKRIGNSRERPITTDLRVYY